MMSQPKKEYNSNWSSNQTEFFVLKKREKHCFHHLYFQFTGLMFRMYFVVRSVNVGSLYGIFVGRHLVAFLACPCLCFKPPWQVHVFFPMYSHFGKFMFVFGAFLASPCFLQKPFYGNLMHKFLLCCSHLWQALPSPRVAKNTLCQAGSNGQLCDHEECHDQGAQEGHEECHDQGAQEGHEDQAAREDHQEACHCHEGHEREAQGDQPCAPLEGLLPEAQV